MTGSSGVYECHCHVALDGVDYRNARERHRNGPDGAWVRGVLDAYRRSRPGNLIGLYEVLRTPGQKPQVLPLRVQ